MKGELYRPSNGTEGIAFWDRFCRVCRKNSRCSVFDKALFHDIDPKIKYPKCLTYDDADKPTCTRFQGIGSKPTYSRKRKIPGQTELEI